ncbi:MAG TPA: alpha/beta hydrolase [Rhizomicrobium sp.]|jgi:pimeloyl-ACP methyl ester carboxylesterase
MKVLRLALTAATLICTAASAQAEVKTVVLVHGAFADGSGWKPVAKMLERDGYTVQIVQEPETTFKDDVAATKLILDKAGPCVLVGHSYGGMIITEAGNHPNVKSLVYVAAYQPDVGESAGSLNAKMPAAAHSIAPIGGGFLAVNQAAFPDDFAADLPRPEARFMAISQVPVSAEALGAGVTVAAWKNKPSYGVVAQQDRMINPDLERFLYKRSHTQTIELPGSHAIFLSHPAEVAALIEKAAKASN